MRLTRSTKDRVKGVRLLTRCAYYPGALINQILRYVTYSRKRGPFPQKSDCELDQSADNAKSVVHARENRLTLVCSVPKLQSFKYHTRAYLGFEISAFISVL